MLESRLRTYCVPGISWTPGTRRRLYSDPKGPPIPGGAGREELQENSKQVNK